MPTRKLPNNLEAEKSVLGACFLSKYALQKACELLQPESFYDEKNSKIFQILIDLGKTKKYLVEQLSSIGVNYQDIDYVFLTHTHDDHISALNVFLKDHKATLVISKDMYKQLKNIDQIEHVLVYDDNPVIGLL